MAHEQLSCGCLRNPSGLSHLRSTFGWRLVAPTINVLNVLKNGTFCKSIFLLQVFLAEGETDECIRHLDSVTVSLFAKDCESLEYIKS